MKVRPCIKVKLKENNAILWKNKAVNLKNIFIKKKMLQNIYITASVFLFQKIN